MDRGQRAPTAGIAKMNPLVKGELFGVLALEC